ncbi:MAG: hypothetical protein QOE62_2743, partial [Actinomycetota bacterium]|nr:hypothetical protein [Actinomycetota bacterium]
LTALPPDDVEDPEPEHEPEPEPEPEPELEPARGAHPRD